MDSREISEIKTLFKFKDCFIARIAGCYVDGEKNIKATFNDNFLSKPEEEIHKYLELMKKTLTGTIGKTLLQFAMEDKNAKSSLLAVRDSGLRKDEMLKPFYESVIDNFEYVGNYLILLTYLDYDVPQKVSDGTKLDDGMDVYSFIMCSICPVELEKPALSFSATEGVFKNRDRDWIITQPCTGFVYPAFSNRQEDADNILYFSKKPEELHPEFVRTILGCETPLTERQQKESFQNILQETFGEECSMEVVQEISEKLALKIEESDKNIPVKVEKEDIIRVLESTGNEDKVAKFVEVYKNHVDEEEFLLAENVVSKDMKIVSPDIQIKVKPDKSSLVTQRIINGTKCIVIDANAGIEVNGIIVN